LQSYDIIQKENTKNEYFYIKIGSFPLYFTGFARPCGVAGAGFACFVISS